ncbi:50S ribosomal protein L4 [Halodesulfovibrio marinisediminis]|uniref:Large ribosomal subunit protein uL4 n=1 Tax=Halodesulfovibrio marinisediminis DSM 17456 TaxID=1121457 RepID=A0A1N6DLG2_9BACT|nr:50S ribosomal protein L4 [Halodesulfovibrio marinisediminis]SIN71590.1 LSU ribosomal protein L4P [Halodesulfovibrio marinisediminis DSM 17456]
MAVVKLYDQNKAEAGEITLAPEVFEVEVKPEILNLVVRAQRAAKRAGTHAVKGRSDVRGGGAKPWRQKGTGRARAGSSRSPIWRGGAVIFGPQPRDYGFKVNKKVRRLAIKMALSSRLAGENLMVVNGIELPEVKTKLMAGVAEALGLNKALIVVKDIDEKLVLSARNLPGITVQSVEQLNVYDVLRHKQLVLLEGAVESVQERLK